MKNYLTLIALYFTTASLMASTLSPVGFWRTIDDVTGKPKAIVEVAFNEKQQLQGRILKVFQGANDTPQTTCLHCPGDKKNQPLIGLIFMEGLVKSNRNPNHFEKGTILDPKNGKVYHCQLDVDAQSLKVRGYIGLPLLGRTQTWERLIAA